MQAERGFVEVVSPLQVKFAVRKAEGGLLKLEPMELPAEFRLLSGAPALAVYQYTARPFSLEMSVEWYAQAETADQVVDFAQALEPGLPRRAGRHRRAVLREDPWAQGPADGDPGRA